MTVFYTSRKKYIIRASSSSSNVKLPTQTLPERPHLSGDATLVTIAQDGAVTCSAAGKESYKINGCIWITQGKSFLSFFSP